MILRPTETLLNGMEILLDSMPQGEKAICGEYSEGEKENCAYIFFPQ